MILRCGILFAMHMKIDSFRGRCLAGRLLDLALRPFQHIMFPPGSRFFDVSGIRFPQSPNISPIDSPCDSICEALSIFAHVQMHLAPMITAQCDAQPNAARPHLYRTRNPRINSDYNFDRRESRRARRASGTTTNQRIETHCFGRWKCKTIKCINIFMQLN